MDILRPNPGILQQARPVFPLFQGSPTYIGIKILEVVYLAYLRLVGYIVVMKNLSGAMGKAAAVGQHDQLFAVVIRPRFQMAQVLQIPIELSLNMERVKKIRNILHCFNGTDFHVN